MASTIVTHIILFIAVLGIASGMLVSVNNYTNKAEGTLKLKGDAFNNQVRTNFEIEYIYYNNNTNETKVYVRNTGETSLKIDQVDLYIDDVRFPRDVSNRTIEVLADTDTKNTGIWDPKEQLLIVGKKYLSDSETHELSVTTQYNGKKSETFST